MKAYREVVMKENDLISPREIREWFKDPAYIEAVREGGEHLVERPLDVGGLLVGIRFLHNFVKTREGKLAVKRAFDESLVQLVPGESDDDKIYVIPRLLWRDEFYEDLCPNLTTRMMLRPLECWRVRCLSAALRRSVGCLGRGA
jgi:hypothetical protein